MPPDADDDLARPPAPSAWPVALGLTILTLLVANGCLGWLLWRAEKAQGLRLARLEGRFDAAATAPPAPDSAKPILGSHPRRAGIDERVAQLLAVAGDPDRSRRVLDSVSPEESERIAQDLIARPAANDRNAALAATVGAIGRTDPASAVALLGAVPEPVLRARLAANLADTWAASHPEDAARWLLGDGTRYVDPASAGAPLLRALAQWAAFDPEGATKFAADQPPDRGPITRGLGLAATAWGHKDPAAALAWMQTLPATDQRRDVLTQGIWQGWAEQSPAQAADALGPQLYGGAQVYTDLAGTVARAWAATDPGAGARWAMALPAGAAKRNALYQVAVAWTQSDPTEASRWAANLPASVIRPEIWREVVGTWADADLDAAGSWLGALPLGRDHDEAVAAYLPKIEGNDPERALSWTGTISDGGARAELVQAILGRWAQRDAAAARNWAAASGVPVPTARLAP